MTSNKSPAFYNSDEEGITLFAVHYSINKPVIDTEAGDWNEDILERTG